MTDNEMRGVVLQKFYELRRQGNITPEPSDFDPPIPSEDLFHICEQLGDHGLLDWQPLRGLGVDSGMGRITALGVDVVETKGSSSPIGITFTHTQHISINHSQAVQIGSGNIQSFSIVVDNFITQLEQANASEEEKKEAKARLKAFLEHPLVTSVLGGLALELIKRLGL